MKYILMVLPGSADQPTEELTQKTPFEVAKLPHLHHLAKIGRVGLAKLTPDRQEVSPDVTLLNAMGYEGEKIFTGRGPLEAANMELKLEPNEIAFRMNLITESNGCLADPTGGQIATKEAKALINFLNKKVANDFVRFFAGERYSHVAVIKDSHGYEALSAKTTAPETIIGEPIENYLPKGPGEELLKKLMYDAKLLLQDHEVNQVRVDLGENPANMIWMWGQGPQPKLDPFSQLHGVSGALMSEAAYAKGIARLACLSAMDMPGLHSDDADEKVKAGRLISEVMEEKECVVLYFPDIDHAARAGDLRAKISALETVDFFVTSRIREFMDKKKDVRVLVTSAHATPWKTRKPLRDAVPFVIAGKNIMPDDVERFSEITAKASGVKLPNGREMMKAFLSK